jgi:hypothetical protein
MMGIVEAVARALCSDTGTNPDEMVQHPAQKSWEPPSVKAWERWEHEARISLKAAATWMAQQAKEEWEVD